MSSQALCSRPHKHLLMCVLELKEQMVILVVLVCTSYLCLPSQILLSSKGAEIDDISRAQQSVLFTGAQFLFDEDKDENTHLQD